MTINFYSCADDPRAITKTLTLISTTSAAYMRDPESVRTPSLLVESDSIPTAVNYLYISELGRYYYIDDIQLERTGLYRLACRCDVLMTFDAAIRALNATVVRSANLNNGYLLDDKYKAYAYEEIVCKAFPYSMTDDSIVLLTVG